MSRVRSAEVRAGEAHECHLHPILVGRKEAARESIHDLLGRDLTGDELFG